jgi:hypothetical protein
MSLRIIFLTQIKLGQAVSALFHLINPVLHPQ